MHLAVSRDYGVEAQEISFPVQTYTDRKVCLKKKKKSQNIFTLSRAHTRTLGQYEVGVVHNIWVTGSECVLPVYCPRAPILQDWTVGSNHLLKSAALTHY